MIATIRGWARDAGDRALASDPGLGRLRMACHGVVAMASTLGVEYLYGRLVGLDPRGSLVAMLLGAVVAMIGSMALGGSSARDKIRTAVFFPVAFGVGMTAGAAVARHQGLLLGVFVLVMFAAVYIRRFGIPFLFYGFMGWIGYFFVSFLGVPLGGVPMLVGDVALAAAWVLLLSLTVLRSRPDRVLHRTLGAFRARARAVADASAEVLEHGGPERRTRRLHSRQVRLTETALMIEGQLDDPSALPEGWAAAELRQRLIDAQLAIDEFAMAATELSSVDSDLAAPARRTALHLAKGQLNAAEKTARELLDAAARHTDPEARRQARHLATSALDYVSGTRHLSVAPPEGNAAGSGDFEPAITLMMGQLPGSTTVARGVSARGGRWNPLTRLELTTRQAVQAALAGGLAIVLGYALSPARYYWAVIAAFVVFTGTATRSETFVKAFNRVLGTLAGLWVAILLARLTAGDTVLILAVIFASLFCGLYLMRLSYAYMIFFITIMVAQLYSVLGRFSDHVLVVRLEETALGAAAGVFVALLIVPVSTRDTARAARANFYATLGELLDAAARRLADADAEVDLDGLTRTLDDRLRQLSLVLSPLLFAGGSARVRHRIALHTACTTYARRLTSALRNREEHGDPADFAEPCRALAAAAKLAGGGDADEYELTVVEYLDHTGRGLVERAEGRNESEPHPVERPLTHLQQLLVQLEPGSVDERHHATAPT